MKYPRSKEKELDRNLFDHPSSEYRGAPFWAWNCALEKEEMLRQIDAFKTMGMGGFHMHVRTGMATPYLSEEYMDYVALCVEKAKKEGMLAYLYDEDRWPSGTCGGRVTREDPSFGMMQLLFTPVPYGTANLPVPRDNAWAGGTRTEQGRLLAIYEVTIDGDGCLAAYRRLSEKEAAGREGLWYAYEEYTPASPWFNNAPYVDGMNEKAVARFLETTYDAYYERFGADFGGVIPSVFTDEPQIAMKGFLPEPESRCDVCMPWTAGTDELFRKKKGYSLLDVFPEIIWELPEGRTSRARYDFFDFVAGRFADVYCGMLGNWCDRHGIALAGHLVMEDELSGQTKAFGDAMRCYRAWKKMPGMDLLCDRREFNTVIQCRSAMRQQGGEAVLSELYGVTGWDFDFRGFKLQGDWQAALGVTMRVPHLTWMSMKGEAKRDYPSSIGYQSPWWDRFSLIEDHFARLNTALTRGEQAVRVAVIHPVESFWLLWGPAAQTAAARADMDRRHRTLTEYLVGGLIDFDFISEATLPELCAKGTNPLRVGIAAYDAVIVPGFRTLRSTTLDRLEAFRDAGGRLLFIGEKPTLCDAEKSERPVRLFERSENLPFDRTAILNALSDLRFADVVIEQVGNASAFKTLLPGTRPSDLVCQTRKDGDQTWFFLCHGFAPVCPDVDPCLTVSLRFKGAFTTVLFDTLTGSVRPVPASLVNGETVVRTPFFMHDSLLFRLTPGDPGKEDPGSAFSKRPVAVLDGRVPVQLNEPNALLLDMAEWSVDGGPWHPQEEILRLDNAVRTELGLPLRKKAVAQPYVVPPEPPVHRVKLRFIVPSELPLSDVRLALEDADKAMIFLNGDPVSSRPSGWYVDKCLSTVLLPEIPAGENVIEAEFPFGAREGLEWCYLLGDFGVRVDGTVKTLISPVRTLSFGDYSTQGLPFYTGNVTYLFDAAVGTDGVFSLRVPAYRGALIEVALDDERIGDIVFSPYRLTKTGVTPGNHRVALTLVGTRQNGFAQVHHVPGVWFYQNPDSWRSEGDLWSREYVLKPFGILRSPELG